VITPRSQLSFRVEILLVALACLLAFGLRSYPIYDQVFKEDGVRMMGADPFFHMRTVDNLTRHFPQRSGFDPYMVFPGGQNVPTGPFFDWLVAGTALILGGGSPDQQVIDFAGAWIPVVIGALTVALVWLVGRILFGAVAALSAAFLAAVLPGNFFELSRLGFPDHHCAEALLFVATWAALAFAVDAGIEAGRRYWLAVSAAGLLLGAFLANRPAGVFLAAFLVLWFGVECLARHYRRESCREIGLAGAVVFGLAAAVFVPTGGMIWSEITLLGLAGGFASVVACAILADYFTARQAPWVALPLALAGAAVLLVGAAFLAAPQVFAGLGQNLARLSSSQTVLTVRELQPLFLGQSGRPSLQPAYFQFTTAIFLFPAAFAGILMRSWGGREDSNRRLFLVLAVCSFAAVLAQNRMSIYAAPVIAVAVGWLIARIAEADLRKPVRVAALAVAAAVVYIPNAYALVEQAPALTGINDEWVKALRWVRDETPEPLGDPDAYFTPFPLRSAADGPFPYPPSAYSFMVWWDYGYWLLREGRRMPAANGTQSGAREAARFFVEDDPELAAAILREKRSRYVVADPTLPLWRQQDMEPNNAKFRSMLIWAGVDPREYCEFFIRIREGRPEIVTVFHPKYYRSMLARLYIFDGEAVEPSNSTWVISSQERRASFGSYRRISSMQRFESYEKAQAYVDRRPDQNLTIAGLLPQLSCVPLEKLDDYSLAYASRDDRLTTITGYRSVKVFEYEGLDQEP